MKVTDDDLKNPNKIIDVMLDSIEKMSPVYQTEIANRIMKDANRRISMPSDFENLKKLNISDEDLESIDHIAKTILLLIKDIEPSYQFEIGMRIMKSAEATLNKDMDDMMKQIIKSRN